MTNLSALKLVTVALVAMPIVQLYELLLLKLAARPALVPFKVISFKVKGFVVAA